MSEQPKKARDIKDLKARLARPSTGAPGVGPGPVSGIPAPLPMQGAAPAPGIPRGAVPAPFGAPPPGGSMRPPSDPFAPPPAAGPSARPMPAGLPSRPPTMAPGRSVPPGSIPGVAPSPSMAPGPLDPFAAAPASSAGPREVRLVIDDKAVSDAEVGRKSGGKIVIAAIAAALVGTALGGFIGGTARERQIYEIVVADAKEIYKSANDATATVEKAQQLINQAAKAAQGAEVDFKALEELRKLEKPFPADKFSRKYYRAFAAGTVDSLFTYYNNTNLLWAKIGGVTTKNLSPSARDLLVKAAKSQGELSKNEFGCVPFKDEKNFSCGLVAVARGDDGKLTVSTRGASFPKEAFAGQDLNAKTSDYVIMIDKGRSNDILGAQTSMFQTYVRDIAEAKILVDQTVELQGRLIKELGAASTQ